MTSYLEKIASTNKKLPAGIVISSGMVFLFGILLSHESADKQVLLTYSVEYFSFLVLYLVALTIFLSFLIFSLSTHWRWCSALIICFLSLLFAEAGARFGYSYVFHIEPEKITDVYMFHPYKVYEIIPNSIDSSGRNHNSFGFRAAEFSKQKMENEYRIFCVGGSTTYSEGARDGHSYPEQLQKYLNAALKAKSINVRVINAGVRSYNSLQSLINYLSNVLQYFPDMVIVQIGVNDASCRMMDNYREDFAHGIKPFQIPERRYWENSLLITILLKMFTSPRNEWFPNKGYFLEEAFLKDNILDHFRKKGGHEEQTPGNIQKHTPASFQRNLKIFKAVSDAFGVKIVFITTPFNYNKSGEWGVATEEHNALIKKFSSKENIPLVTLDTQIKWNKELFMDDVHLNEKGQVLKAKIVTDYILNNGIILNH